MFWFLFFQILIEQKKLKYCKDLPNKFVVNKKKKKKAISPFFNGSYLILMLPNTARVETLKKKTSISIVSVHNGSNSEFFFFFRSLDIYVLS